MPRRSISALGRITEADLPILPFLAPRVFAPWPTKLQLRRSYQAVISRETRDIEEPKDWRDDKVHHEKRLDGRVQGEPAVGRSNVPRSSEASVKHATKRPPHASQQGRRRENAKCEHLWGSVTAKPVQLSSAQCLYRPVSNKEIVPEGKGRSESDSSKSQLHNIKGCGSKQRCLPRSLVASERTPVREVASDGSTRTSSEMSPSSAPACKSEDDIPKDLSGLARKMKSFPRGSAAQPAPALVEEEQSVALHKLTARLGVREQSQQERLLKVFHAKFDPPSTPDRRCTLVLRHRRGKELASSEDHETTLVDRREAPLVQTSREEPSENRVALRSRWHHPQTHHATKPLLKSSPVSTLRILKSVSRLQVRPTLVEVGDEQPFSVTSTQHRWSRLKRRLRHASTVLEHYRREEHTPEGKLKYYEKRLLDLKERLRVMRAALGSANPQPVQPSRIRKYYGALLEVRKISGTNVTKRTKISSNRLTGARTDRAYREILSDFQRTAETTHSMSRLAIRRSSARQGMQPNVTTSTQYQRLQTWGQEMEEVMAQVTQVDHVEESKSNHENSRSRITREPDAASECSLLLAPRKPILSSTQHFNQRAFSHLAAQAQIASTTRCRDPEGVTCDHEAETRHVPVQARRVEVNPRRVRDMRKRRKFLSEFVSPRDAKTVKVTDDNSKDAKIDRARRAADRWKAMTTRPGLRTKYVKISSVKDPVTNDSILGGKDASTVSIPDEFSSLWNETFALLNAKHDARLQDALPTTTEQELDPRVGEWVEALLQDGHEVMAMRRAYEKIELSEKQAYWNNVMLWLLRHSPNIALQFLAATNIRPYQPGFRVAEALEYLVDHDFYDVPTEGLDTTVDSHDALLSLACSLIQRKSETAPPITQRTIYLLLLRCREEQAGLLHRTLVSNGVYLHWNTLLHFASSFAKTGYYDSALDVLNDAALRAYYNEQGKVDVNSQAFLSVCATVLRRSAAEEGGYHSSSRIIATLMEMGVQLNVQLYSIVILNAVEAGDFNTAFRIFDLLKANKVEPNHFTYAILLKGWRDSRDPEALHVIIEDAKGTLGDRIDAVLATEILHCLYLHHKDHNPSSYFAILLQAYREFFDLRTLARLGIVSADYSATFSQPGRSKKMEPLPATLGIMLVSELQSPTGDREEKERELHRLYANFRQSVEQGYPAIGVLAETDHTYNAFLMAFGRHVRLLSHLPQIVRDMTLPLPPTARVRTHGKTTRPIQPCQPTVQTFSILMESFAYHDQVVAAEKVLELMQQRGVEPNQVTWNTLITGYARTQDIEGTVHAMKRMEMQKLDVDQWTLEGVGKIRDREALMTALDQQGRAGREESDKSGDGDASEKTLEDAKERWTA